MYYESPGGPHGLTHKIPVLEVRELERTHLHPMVRWMFDRGYFKDILQIKVMFLGQFPTWININRSQLKGENNGKS